MRDVRPGRLRPSPEVVQITPEQVQPDPFASTPQMVPGPPQVDRSSLLGRANYAATKKDVVLAKNWVRSVFAGAVDEDTIGDLALCADELVDNGRKHGRTDGVISVAAYLTAGSVLLEVVNDALGTTSPRVTVDTAAEEGRGLMIVAAVSARCGSYLNHDTAQVVWCEFERRPQPAHGRREGNDASD